MSKGKSRENYAGHVDAINTTLHLERAGIPHRVSEDLCVEREEGIRVHEGDILEVIHRGNVEWWTVILAEENALINSALLEPIMGSLHTYLSPIEIPDCEQPPFSGSGRKLVVLTPFRPTGKFVDLKPPPFLTTTPISSATPLIQEADSLLEAARTSEEGIRLLAPQVRALRDVTATKDGELSYKKGDIIDVELRSTAEQWQGKLRSQVGTFRLDRSVEPVVKERVRAIWDYSSSAPNDLTFKSGDIIEVCGTSGASNWWLHGWMSAKGFGMFPYNFVESLEDEFPDAEDDKDVSSPLSPVEKTPTRFRVLKDVLATEDGALTLKKGDVINLVERQDDEKWLGRVKLQTGTFLLDNSVEPIMTDRVKAIFSYTTSNPEELSFVVDDCITVIRPSDDSTLWWYGNLNGREGLFPLNFVELIPDERDAARDADDWIEARGPQALRALHNFSGKDPDILSFDAKDIIKVLDAGTDTEWWKGELDGRIGMFPRTYCVEILEGDEKQDDFVFVENEPLNIPEKAGNSFSQAKQEQTSQHVDLSLDMERLAFRRGDPIDIPDLPSPNSKDMVSVPLLPSHYSEPLKEVLNPPSPIAITIPSLTLSTITEVTTPATRSSNDLISASPGQLTPTKPSEDNLPFIRDAPSSLPWIPCFARALYEFEGRGPEELSFLRGDLIQILAMTSTDWWSGELRYQTGRVPTSYLELIDLKGQSQSNAKERVSHESTVPAGPDPEPTPRVTTNQPNPLPDRPRQDSRQKSNRKRGTNKETLSRAEWVRARHAWNSQKAGELVLQAGDIIQVLKRPFEHWWKGRLERNGLIGLFPANFVEAVAPPPEQPESPERLKPQLFALGNDDPVIALRLNVAKLLPLLRNFDMKRDIAENAEIQTLFETSCKIRRKVLRLLAERPDDGEALTSSSTKTLKQFAEELKLLEASFQEVKAHYDEVLELCAKRALEQDAERRPWIPRGSIDAGISFEQEKKQINMKNQGRIPPSDYQLLNNPANESIVQRRDTGDSMHRASLPPTPAPDSSALASMLNKRNSKGEAGGSRRYSGRLSAIEADIKRAKKAYQESIRSKEDAKPRRLPTTENSIAILRSVRDRITARRGINVEPVPDNKTILIPRVEYFHNHVVYENQQPLRKR